MTTSRETYENTWGGVLDRIQNRIAAGERSLSRVLHDAVDHYIDTTPYLTTIDELHRSRGFLYSGTMLRPVHLDLALRMHATQSVMIREVVTAARGGITRIVELGSGYGRNLCWAWLAGAPCDARYHALELTESGRRCSDALASIEPDLELTSHPFDYRQPDFSMLDEDRPTVVFSANSIEQVETVTPDLFEALAAVPGLRSCIHFEPVGWQIEDGSATQSEQAAELDRVNREHAESSGFNRNLAPTLAEMESRGLLRVTRVVKNLVGFNPSNVNTLIEWEPVRS